MVVRWTPNASEGLAAIWEYYKLENIRAAVRIIRDIRAATLSLVNFPEMAPLDPFLIRFSADYRSLVVRRNYKVVYKIDGNYIYIMEIFDCRQNPIKLQDRIVKNRR